LFVFVWGDDDSRNFQGPEYPTSFEFPVYAKNLFFLYVMVKIWQFRSVFFFIEFLQTGFSKLKENKIAIFFFQKIWVLSITECF